MINLQPAEPISVMQHLEVHSLFPTIQGEGPYTGTPAIFVRLAGCNLQCPHCFSASTVIRMADFSTRLIPEINIGDKVLSYDVEEGRFVKKKVTAVMSSQVDQIYRLQTESNKKTFVTGNHPFLVRGRGWTKAEDLQPGDKILHLSLSELRTLHNPMKDKESVGRMLATKEAHYGEEGQPKPYSIVGEAKKREDMERSSRRMTDNNPMKDPEVAIKGYLNRKDRGRMTQAEEFVLSIGEEFGLEFTGGGDLVVGHKVPDFIIKGTTKLVEVWDSTQTEFLNRTEDWMESRRKVYEAEGYEVLFLPVFPYPFGDEVGSRKPERAKLRSEEIYRVMHLLAEYARNGEEVSSITLIDRFEPSDAKAWTALAGTKKARLTVYNFEVEGTHTYIADTMIVHNCDTDYTSRREATPANVLMSQIMKLRDGRDIPLVVITGGEPFRQNLEEIIIKIFQADMIPQVETNGTLFPSGIQEEVLQQVLIVCSPKGPRVHPKLLKFISAYKYIITAGKVSEKDGLPTEVLGMKFNVARPPKGFPKIMTYVQPEDSDDKEQNERNLRATIDISMKFGYNFGVQLHKIVGLP